jgi:hypothetical protein
VTDEEDCLVLAPVGSAQRWVVHKPVDFSGDGYLHSMEVEASDDGISARTSATIEGQTSQNLCDFLNGLARDWRGWSGTRSWTSLEDQMTLDADHDGVGHVTLAVSLRRARRTCDIDAWSARIVLTLEAGEQLSQFADAADHFLRPPSGKSSPRRGLSWPRKLRKRSPWPAESTGAVAQDRPGP